MFVAKINGSSISKNLGQKLRRYDRNWIDTSIRKFSMATGVEETKVKVDGIDINYVKVGKGDHPVLLLPGAMGTIWTDFKPQIDYLNREKLTIVAWDPPGYGKSRPPDKTFPDNFYDRDADWAHNLMKALGYEKFSLIGWSDGGISSLIMAGNYPDSIHKMVVFGANAYTLPEEIKIYNSVKNIDSWSEKMRAPLLAMYGEDYFRKTWSAWVETMERLFNTRSGNLCKSALPNIKCPTLVVHGAKDVMVLDEHPNYLVANIKNAKLHVFQKGAHNLHLRYYKEFNNLVTDFLLQNSKL
ncbi:valacyclovir hydrolase-like isoform X2 [Prorops nasuta]|uniref:valacyclovir hydrolase-like isoform X2 n=1 Tax=Prorops nasuta TaxID=863751 RepID=UPI0034CD0E28